MCHTPNKYGENPASLLGMSFKEPIPALSNVMDTKDMLDIIQTVVGPNNAARLMNTGYRDLEFRGPGAVAHMSLHQKPTMSKSHSTV